MCPIHGHELPLPWLLIAVTMLHSNNHRPQWHTPSAFITPARMVCTGLARKTSQFSYTLSRCLTAGLHHGTARLVSSTKTKAQKFIKDNPAKRPQKPIFPCLISNLEHFKVASRSQVSCQLGGLLSTPKVVYIMKKVDQDTQESKPGNSLQFCLTS